MDVRAGPISGLHGDGSGSIWAHMGESNPLDLLHDDAKSYVTLAASLLAISATFSTRLLGHDQAGRWAVLGAWIALASAIGAGIYAAGAVFRAAQSSSTSYKAPALFLNATVVLIGIGCIALAFGAWRAPVSQVEKQSPSSAAIAAVSEMTGAKRDSISLESLRQTDPTIVTLTATDSTSGRVYIVRIDTETLRAVEITPKP